MGNNLFTTIDNYEIYTNVTDEDAVFLKRESFQIAVQRLVNTLNRYTKGNATKIVNTLLENETSDITANYYVYFDISGSTVGEEEPHIYAIKFAWEPFHCVTINDVRLLPVGSIGSYTGSVRWENNDFHVMFGMEFSDNITQSSWLNCRCINKKDGYFFDLNEYLFNVFMYDFNNYKDSLAYLGYNQKEGVVTGAQTVAVVFSNVADLLSKYPKGIKFNEGKNCTTTDWYYNTLEYVFKELDKKNTLDAAFFYMAMRDYVREIEKTRNIISETKEE